MFLKRQIGDIHIGRTAEKETKREKTVSDRRFL